MIERRNSIELALISDVGRNLLRGVPVSKKKLYFLRIVFFYSVARAGIFCLMGVPGPPGFNQTFSFALSIEIIIVTVCLLKRTKKFSFELIFHFLGIKHWS